MKLSRIVDTHHHFIAPEFRRAFAASSAAAPNLPAWTPEESLRAMDELGIATAILSAPTPGTTMLPNVSDAAALARDLNDYAADLVRGQPDRFGFFATLPSPHLRESVHEITRALDGLGADGVMLPANSAGTYLGQDGQDELFAALDERAAVVLIHPGDLPCQAVSGIAPSAADFLLDTTRAAYLLVRNHIRRRYPNIKFILSHGGGFAPYATHRLAVSITADTGRALPDIVADFAGFYFDTALTDSNALPTLLGFAQPGHITFGSDFPFAPLPIATIFAEELQHYPGLDGHGREAIEYVNARALLQDRT